MADRGFTSSSFYQYLAERKLMATRCKKCKALFLPPRPFCIKCHSTDMEWTQLSGQGKLAAFTAIAVPPSFMAAEGHGRDNPYCVGIVELTEGPKVCARLLGVDPKNPEGIKIGLPLQADFLERTTEGGPRYQLVFKPL